MKEKKRSLRVIMTAIICALCLVSVATVTQTDDSEAGGLSLFIIVGASFAAGWILNDIIEDLTAAEDTYQGDTLETYTAQILDNQLNTLATVAQNDAQLIEKTTTYYAQFASSQAALMHSLSQPYSTEAAMVDAMEDLLQMTRLAPNYYSETLRVFFEANNGGKTGLTYGDGNQYLEPYNNDVQTIEAEKAQYHKLCYAISGNVWLLEGDEIILNGATITMLDGSSPKITYDKLVSGIIEETAVYNVSGLSYVMAAMAYDDSSFVSPAIAKFGGGTGKISYIYSTQDLILSYPGTFGHSANLPASAINAVTAMQIRYNTGVTFQPVIASKTINIGGHLENVATLYAAVAGVYAAAAGSAQAYYEYMAEYGGDIPISPSAVFIAPELLAGLKPYEIQAIYTSYLYFLADWFNSNSVLMPQNVTISQDSINLMVTGSIYEDGIELYPEGSLFSIYITSGSYEVKKNVSSLPASGFLMVWEGGDLPAYVPLTPNMTADITNITYQGLEYDNWTLTPKRLDLILLELQTPTPIEPAPPITWLDLLKEFWWVFCITIGVTVLVVGAYMRLPIALELGLLLILLGAGGWYLSDISIDGIFAGLTDGITDWFRGFGDWLNPF